MAELLNIYSPGDITVTLTRDDGFAHTIGGYMEDAMISVEPTQDTFTMFTSADNRSTLMFHEDTSASVMLTLNQTSPSNDVLTALYKEFRGAKSASKLFTLTVKDNNGRSLYVSPQAFVGRLPTASFANTMQSRDWTIVCHDMDQNAGGNAKFSAADANTLELLGATVEDRWAP
jgi:hypothetical protein